MCKYCVTYEIVTEESAENGEAAESGFVRPGYGDIELPPDCVGEAAAMFRIEYDVDQDIDPEDFEHMTHSLVRNYTGLWVNGDMLREPEASQSMYTGDYRSETLHFDGCSEEQCAFIKGLLAK